MNTIETDYCPNRREFFGSIFIFTLIGFIVVMLPERFLQLHLGGPEYELPKHLAIPLFALAATPGFLFGLWFARKQQDKLYWKLTDTKLISGPSGRSAYPLSSIQKIIVGLPPDRVEKFLRNNATSSNTAQSLDILSASGRNWDRMRKVYLPTSENSLLLCFNDGSWLPLRLHVFPNGTAIMDALKERFKDRLVHNYHFSAEEVRRLRTRVINELIPK